MELAASGLRFQTQLRGSAQTGSLSRATRTLMANWVQTASTSGAGAAAGGSKRPVSSGYMPAPLLEVPRYLSPHYSAAPAHQVHEQAAEVIEATWARMKRRLSI